MNPGTGALQNRGVVVHTFRDRAMKREAAFLSEAVGAHTAILPLSNPLVRTEVRELTTFTSPGDLSPRASVRTEYSEERFLHCSKLGTKQVVEMTHRGDSKMQIRTHGVPFMGAIVLALGCANPPQKQEEAAEPRAESPPAPEQEADKSEAIRSRNEEILERLREEELARKKQAAPPQETTRDSLLSTQTSILDEPTRSSMEEMQARAAELEPRMAEIGRIADRVDENYRRYMDACYEKYTTGTTSPHAATLYYEPYQPIAISNETTPYCRELWSDIEGDAEEVELAMKALTEAARQRGVLPGHVRDLARKYRLDREGWRS